MNRPNSGSMVRSRSVDVLRSQAVAPDSLRVVESRSLLGDQSEIAIRHGDRIYRLRRTRNGKLILTA